MTALLLRAIQQPTITKENNLTFKEQATKPFESKIDP